MHSDTRALLQKIMVLNVPPASTPSNPWVWFGGSHPAVVRLGVVLTANLHNNFNNNYRSNFSPNQKRAQNEIRTRPSKWPKRRPKIHVVGTNPTKRSPPAERASSKTSKKNIADFFAPTKNELKLNRHFDGGGRNPYREFSQHLLGGYSPL